MLSRTADHLYWMSRYNERAENLARLLDAHYRLSLLPRPPEAVRQGWAATLTSLGTMVAYRERHGDVSAAVATRFLAFERDHPGSILACLRSARRRRPLTSLICPRWRWPVRWPIWTGVSR